MPVRLLLAAALALTLLACGDAADAPSDPPGEDPGVVPPPAAPDGAGLERQAEAGGDRAADTGAVVIRRHDEAPPAPVAIEGAVGSCDVREVEPVCFAFSGTGWTTAAAQTECAEAVGGVFQSAACPVADRVGECVYRPDGDAAREVVYTFYAPMDPLIAEAVCRGTFRAF